MLWIVDGAVHFLASITSSIIWLAISPSIFCSSLARILYSGTRPVHHNAWPIMIRNWEQCNRSFIHVQTNSKRKSLTVNDSHWKSTHEQAIRPPKLPHGPLIPHARLTVVLKESLRVVRPQPWLPIPSNPQYLFIPSVQCDVRCRRVS